MAESDFLTTQRALHALGPKAVETLAKVLNEAEPRLYDSQIEAAREILDRMNLRRS